MLERLNFFRAGAISTSSVAGMKKCQWIVDFMINESRFRLFGRSSRLSSVQGEDCPVSKVRLHILLSVQAC